MQHINFLLHTFLEFIPIPYINPSKYLLDIPHDGAEHRNPEMLCSGNKTSESTVFMSQKEHALRGRYPFPVHGVKRLPSPE